MKSCKTTENEIYVECFYVAKTTSPESSNPYYVLIRMSVFLARAKTISTSFCSTRIRRESFRQAGTRKGVQILFVAQILNRNGIDDLSISNRSCSNEGKVGEVSARNE